MKAQFLALCPVSQRVSRSIQCKASTVQTPSQDAVGAQEYLRRNAQRAGRQTSPASKPLRMRYHCRVGGKPISPRNALFCRAAMNRSHPKIATANRERLTNLSRKGRRVCGFCISCVIARSRSVIFEHQPDIPAWQALKVLYRLHFHER